MRRILFCIFLFAFNEPSECQTITAISKSICDSINKVTYKDEGKRYVAQLGIYAHELIKYPTLLVDITGMNRPHQFNEFSYKINRELLKTCPAFQDQFSLMPLSKILDVEGLFDDQHYDSLEKSIVNFINSKKMNLVISTIDDPFPYINIKQYTTTQGMRWSIGSKYEKGGILLVLSKSLNSAELYIDHSPKGGIDFNSILETIDDFTITDKNRLVLFREIIEIIDQLTGLL